MKKNNGKYPLELNIRMGHLEHNYRQFKSLVKPSVKIMAMVKADAYGCGAVEVSKKLETLGANHLAVALTQEGVELRKAGIRLPVMVMAPLPEEFPTLIKYQLEPEISSIDLLEDWITFSNENKDGMCDFHLKIDTGLHRLGLSESDITQLIEKVKENRKVSILSVFSHLSSSPLAAHDLHTNRQFEKFENSCRRISEAFDIRPDRHILNSAGIYRFPEYQYEMVRLGVGLYGVGLEDLEINKTLRPVQELRTSIAQIKEIEAGEAIGYSRREIAAGPMKIAILRIGYADGVSRRAGNRRFSVRIGEAICPVIGNICMDMIMVDITEHTDITVGSEVEIYGSKHPVQLLAEASDTIPYEILTANHRRARKKYSH